MPWSEQLHSFMQQQQWRKWWPKYAEGNVQWLNINFMIIIIFHIKISYSVSISWLSSFSHSIEDREIFLFIKEEISFKIIHLNLKHSHDIFIRDKWNFSSLLWRFSNLVTFLMSYPWTSSCPIVQRCNLNFRSWLLYFHKVLKWQIVCFSSVQRYLSWTMPQRESCYLGLPVKYL